MFSANTFSVGGKIIVADNAKAERTAVISDFFINISFLLYCDETALPSSFRAITVIFSGFTPESSGM